VADSPCQEGFTDEMSQPLAREPGQFLGMVVVERKQCIRQRRGRRHFRGGDRKAILRRSSPRG
jgi:hypothetical protein